MPEITGIVYFTASITLAVIVFTNIKQWIEENKEIQTIAIIILNTLLLYPIGIIEIICFTILETKKRNKKD